MQTMASIGALRDFHSGYATVTWLELIIIPILLGTIALIAGWVALVPASLLLLFVVAQRRRFRDLLGAAEQRDQSDTTRYDYIISTFSELHSIKALALEPFLVRNYEHLKKRSTMDGYKTSGKLLAIFDVSATFSSLITLGTIMAGAAAALQGTITAGGLIACILLAGRIMQPARRALSLQAQKQDFLIASERVDAVLCAKRPHEVAGGTATKPAYGESDRLELDKVTLQFGDKPPLIEDATFTARARDVVLIDGAAGSGRSTLLRAIAGTCIPTVGEVRIGGAPVLSLSVPDRNRLIGYLPTQGEIYRGTILDNLSRFGETPFADVAYLVRLLEFEGDIARLPAGMETRLEGTGVDPIPPGLKQRIAFGRSLASRPKIILFDSADTGLDRISYEALYRLFSRLKGKATIVMVTDDNDLRTLATRRCEIRDGQLIEDALQSDQAVPIRRYKEISV